MNNLMNDIYYLWWKYQSYNTYSLNREFKGKRLQEQFNKLLNLKIFENMAKGINYNGQTKSEYTKNFTRVKDIITKSNGDEEIAIKLSRIQAVRITDEWKAINRAMAARDLGQEHIFDVFFYRAYELGTVTKQDYRDYQLEKLGIK